MKNIKYLFTAILLLCVTVVNAHHFEVDGIYYNITSSTNKTVEVTYRGDSYSDYSNEYSGDVTIPSSVTYNGTTYSVKDIGVSAFRSCSGLTSVTIPNSVASIGEGAFEFCSGLTSIVIPNSVTSIGDYAFYNCSALKEVHISDLSAWCKIDFVDNYANPLSNAGNLYLNGNLLTELVIPDDITEIKSYAFNGCFGLTSIEIPNSITCIGVSAFDGCYDLTNIEIPSSVTSIGDYAFYGTAWYRNQPNGLLYLGDVLYDYKGTMPENTSITIKDGTSAILGGAFEYCDGLTSVVIPNSVTRIGDCAFRHCRSLTSLEIPSSVTSLGDEAFTNCYGLTSVTIGNGVASIGNYAFYACHALTSIEIPNSVTGIGDGAFYSCDALTNVTIGTGVKSIGFEAFNFCSALKEVHISDLSAWCKIDFVDNYANPLYYAGNLYLNGNLLTELVIPNDITEIYSYTFSNCSALTSVTIGNNVTRIGSSAFEGCDKISKIEIESAENISIYSNSFNDNVYNNATLYVPKGRKEYYENNYYWSKIKNIEEVAYKVTYIIDGKQYNSIELGAGSPVPTEGPIKEGYTFNGWENLPEIMPTYDITVYGSYTINKYTITYRVDGEFYKSETYEYGAKIPEADMLYKKGYIFSGWYGLPSTMPARNIIVTSSFTLDTTAVDSVEGESRDRIIYDLNGNRINGTETLERGVYIVDGVKVLVR